MIFSQERSYPSIDCRRKWEHVDERCKSGSRLDKGVKYTVFDLSQDESKKIMSVKREKHIPHYEQDFFWTSPSFLYNIGPPVSKKKAWGQQTTQKLSNIQRMFAKS